MASAHDEEKAVRLRLATMTGRSNYFELKQIVRLWKDNEDVIALAVRRDVRLLEFVSDAFKANRKVVLLAIQKNGSALQHASPELRRCPAFVRAAIETNFIAVQHMDASLYRDRFVVLAAASHKMNGFSYGKACEAMLKLFKRLEPPLSCDREIVVALMRFRDVASNLLKISEDVRSNRELVLTAFGGPPLFLCELSGAFGDDPPPLYSDEFWKLKAMQAMQLGELDAKPALEYAHAFQDDEEIVRRAIESDILNLHHASNRLKGSEDVILHAIGRHGLAFFLHSCHVTQQQRESKDFVAKAVGAHPSLYLHLRRVQSPLAEDADIVKRALAAKVKDESMKDKILNAVPPSILKRHDVGMLVAASWHGCKRALLRNQYFKLTHREDVEVLCALMRNGPADEIRYVHHESLTEKAYLEITLAAVRKDSQAYLHCNLRDNKKVALAAVEEDGRFLRKIDKPLRSDLDVCCAAVKSEPSAYRLVPSVVKKNAVFKLSLCATPEAAETCIDKVCKDDKVDDAFLRVAEELAIQKADSPEWDALFEKVQSLLRSEHKIKDGAPYGRCAKRDREAYEAD